MARKEIIVEELVEVLYQWHQGRNIRQIKRSLGFDRKSIRPMARMRNILNWRNVTDYPERCHYSNMIIICSWQAPFREG